MSGRVGGTAHTITKQAGGRKDSAVCAVLLCT